MGEFLKLKEVTRDTLNEFCSNKMYDVLISRTQNKQNKDLYNCQLHVKIHNEIKLPVRISESDFNVICLDRGFNKESQLNFAFKAPCRIVKGYRKDGTIYYMADCLITDFWRRSIFFDENQERIMKKQNELGLPVIERPETTVEDLSEAIWPSQD